MRTNIEIDHDLLAEAMAASGLSTKKATVEEALRRLVPPTSAKEGHRGAGGGRLRDRRHDRRR